MKRFPKWAVIVLVMVAALSVAGCSNLENMTATQVPSSEKTVAALTVNSATTSYRLESGDRYATPSVGNKFLLYNVTVTNLNQSGLSLGYTSFFKLTTSNGAIYSSTMYSSLPGQLAGVQNTNPGEKLTGQLIFEVPQSAQATMLTYGDGYYAAVTRNVTNM